MASQTRKQKLQYTYCPISQEKRQSDNEIWSVNIT